LRGDEPERQQGGLHLPPRKHAPGRRRSQQADGDGVSDKVGVDEAATTRMRSFIPGVVLP
jgi:hypothetical protein